LPLHATFDKDDWRTDRMYNEDVSILLKSVEPQLVALFDFYVCKNNQARMEVPAMTKLLTAKGVFGKDLQIRDAIKAFLLSQNLTKDEMRPRRTRSIIPQPYNKTLSFVDFLELLCRLADMIIRGDIQGCLPWDVEKEGRTKGLADIVDDFLENYVLRDKKARLKDALGKVKAMTAISAPAKRLRNLLEQRQRVEDARCAAAAAADR
jgi:hypothetical protein